jgi:hypothetical protein
VRPQGVYRGTHPPASRYGPLGLLNVKGERVSYNGRWYDICLYSLIANFVVQKVNDCLRGKLFSRRNAMASAC